MVVVVVVVVVHYCFIFTCVSGRTIKYRTITAFQ